MRNVNKRKFYIAIGMFVSFLLWTVVIRFLDVQIIGPRGSAVGFATVNQFVHDLTGVHMLLYHVTDWLGIIPICFMLGFAMLGLVQWIKRKHILKVDHSILVLGVFYFIVTAVYVFFELFVINYRPVLINNRLEASYPSSTTMLVMTVMPMALIQFNIRIKNKSLRRFVAAAIGMFIIFMVAARLISGVHWFTDIVGGALFSISLVLAYHETICFNDNRFN